MTFCIYINIFIHLYLKHTLHLSQLCYRTRRVIRIIFDKDKSKLWIFFLIFNQINYLFNLIVDVLYAFIDPKIRY